MQPRVLAGVSDKKKRTNIDLQNGKADDEREARHNQF